LVDEFERRDDPVTSFMFLRNGKRISEFCKPLYDKDSVQLRFSVKDLLQASVSVLPMIRASPS
jgi:hypothetical protein